MNVPDEPFLHSLACPFESTWGYLNKLMWLRAATLHATLKELEGPPSRWWFRWYTGGQNFCLYRPGSACSPGGYAQVPAPDVPLSQALVAHTVQAQLGCGATVVGLFNSSLRVCRSCLSRGYHCILHQFSGCARCVIDGGELLTTCPRCRGPLGEFAPRNIGEAFRCRHCGVSWLRPADQLPSLTRGQRSQLRQRLSAPMNWLRGVYRLPTIRSGLPFWPIAGTWVDEASIKAIVLTSAGAPQQFRRCMNALPVSLRAVPEDVATAEWIVRYSDSALCRRIEHLQRLREKADSRLFASLGSHRRCVQDMAGHIRVSHVSGGQRVFLDAQGCALGQAWWLFRLHFECALRVQCRGWYIYDDSVNASDALVERMVGFFHACFLAVRVCSGSVQAPEHVRHAFAEHFLVLGGSTWLLDEREYGVTGVPRTRLLYFDPAKIRAYRHRRRGLTDRAV